MSPRIDVVAGDPTPDELVALTLALTRTDDREPPEHPPSRWLRAARYEACGGPPAAAPADLPGRWGVS